MQKKVFLPFLMVLMICACQICQSSFSNSAFAKKIKVYTPTMEYKYQQKILRQEEKEKYQRSLLPDSGCMRTEEYENRSKDITNEERVIPPPELPKDIKMKYVPQPTYKMVHYNNPPGSPELHIGRRFKFDRQVNCPGITSPNKDLLVYPAVYYYVNNQCTACDLYQIPLDQSLPYVERIQRANIIKRNPTPILSTEKNISEKFTFRTMTPIDFSVDGTKLLAKEKIGNINDGIWQTNAWVYDFNTKQSRNLSEVRAAIRYYWSGQGVALDEKRWDIYPLGFDANDENRVVVSAYGYTGKVPRFLGTWSIDCNGERTQLISLLEANAKVSENGFKIVQDGVVNPVVIRQTEKQTDKLAKQKRKKEKKELKNIQKQKKKALKIY